MKFKEFDDKVFQVKRLKPDKVKDLNPKTNRMKTYRRTAYITTEIPMEKRNFKNLPRYANDTPKVHYKDWLGIKSEKVSQSHSVNSIGKAEADGKWYGWSHRAIYGFGVGDSVKPDTIGNASGKEYIIRTEDEAKQAAISFAKEVS